MSRGPRRTGRPSAISRLLQFATFVLGAAMAIAPALKPLTASAPALAGGSGPEGTGAHPDPSEPALRADQAPHRYGDRAPGDEQDSGNEPGAGHLGYAVGLGLAVLLTAVSFVLVGTGLVWAPSLPIAVTVLAVAQMGVHLVFFLHIGSGPESTNNILALAFGVLIVFLLIAGSMWIMGHLNHNMIPMDQIIDMQR